MRTLFPKKDRAELRAETKDGEVISAPYDVAEQMRFLMRRSELLESHPAVVAITSAVSGEGVTYVANALAVTAANDTERRVCIVSLDWSKPAPSTGGSIIDVASGEAYLDDALIPTDHDRLFVLPAGEIPLLERAGFARSAELRQVVEEVSDGFDIVILDVPAVGESSDSLALTGLADQTFVVVRQGGAPIEQIRLALDDLGRDRLGGVVLNDAAIKAPSWLVDPMVAS